MFKCIVCGEEMPDYEPIYCCDGRECACMGEPIEPLVCSIECWERLLGNKNSLCSN